MSSASRPRTSSRPQPVFGPGPRGSDVRGVSLLLQQPRLRRLAAGFRRGDAGPPAALRRDRTRLARALPHLALAGGDLAQVALRLGGVGDGEACEESHDGLLRWLRAANRLNRFAGVTNTS